MTRQEGRDAFAAEAIHLMENHDEAYHVWQAAKVKGRVLVHIDAHHDLYGKWATAKERVMTIANYLYPAVEADMVREVIWVVPDQSWATSRGQRDIQQAVRHIDTGSSVISPHSHMRDNGLTATVLGKPLKVCSLAHLPIFDEPVLLDIDVDYLIIPNVGYRGIYAYGEVPWCWPQDVVAQLQRCHLHADLVTIAYSVEGGYTPLQWKYLGDELALRLGTADTPGEALEGMDALRTAALAIQRRDYKQAEEMYDLARALLPQSAAPDYHLAHLHVVQERRQDAQVCYQKALSIDASYRTAYNSAGLWYHANRRFRFAQRAHQRVLALDATDTFAHLGMGLLAIRSKKWREAEASLRTALACNDHSVDVLRALGTVLEKVGRDAEAIEVYERSLNLALTGQRSIADDMIITDASASQQLDPGHGDIHSRLARLYARRGATRVAIAGYRMGIAGGSGRITNHLHLGRLWLRQGQWRHFWQETWRAMRLLPYTMNQARAQSIEWLKRKRKVSWRYWLPRWLPAARNAFWH